MAGKWLASNGVGMKSHGFTTHGWKHPFYRCWSEMIRRCRDPRRQNYAHYGGRGIKVCERWSVFQNFADDMLPTWSLGMTIERKNNAGNYEPENCCWVEFKQQSRNRRNNTVIELSGVRMCLSAWLEKLGVKRVTYNRRVKSGMSVTAALLTPVRKWTPQS